MSETPFQRALDRVEDVIFRMSPRQRACLVRGTLQHMRRNLPEDHPTITAFLANHEGYRHRALANIAKVHQGWPWWLPILLVWNSLTAGIDVFEYAVSWWLVQRRWVPNRAIGWILATLALVCVDVRRAKAAPAPIPAYCLAALRAPVQAAQIGFLSAGWRWFPAWMLRPRADLPDPEPTINQRALMNGIMRAGLAAVIVLSFVLPSDAHQPVLIGALSANTVWEVRTTGSSVKNGGGFVTGASGTDWSQQDSPQYAVTDGVTAGTTTITSATANFGTDVVGNLIFVEGGTGAVTGDWYQITARGSATSITVDRSTGLTAGTGVTLNIGGALPDPAIFAGKLVAGNTVYQKSGTYSITSASTNVAGGCVSIGRVHWEGYQTTRGDVGTKPLFQASGISTFTLFAIPTQDASLRNVAFDGASLTSSRAVSLTQRCLASRLNIVNCTNTGYIASGGGALVSERVYASGCTTTGSAISALGGVFASEATANSVTGITAASEGRLSAFCISYANTGASTDGFSICNGVNLTAHGNGRDGVLISTNSGMGSVLPWIAFHDRPGAPVGPAPGEVTL